MIKCVIFQKGAQNNQQCLQMQHNWPALSTQPPTLSFYTKKKQKQKTYTLWQLEAFFSEENITHTEPCLLAHHAVSDWTFPWRQSWKNKLAKQKSLRKAGGTYRHQAIIRFQFVESSRNRLHKVQNAYTVYWTFLKFSEQVKWLLDGG